MRPNSLKPATEIAVAQGVAGAGGNAGRNTVPGGEQVGNNGTRR